MGCFSIPPQCAEARNSFKQCGKHALGWGKKELRKNIYYRNENFRKFHKIFNFDPKAFIGNPLYKQLAADVIWGTIRETLTVHRNLDLVAQGALRWLEMDVERCQRLRKHSSTSSDRFGRS